MCQNICNNCKAPKHIQESLGCNCDRIHNNLEVIMSNIFETFRINYAPKFKCRFKDLLDGGVTK